MTGKLPPHPPEEPWHVHQPFPPHHHHHHDDHHVAPECDDQLAAFSGVGRGLRGDGYKVVIKSDVEAETYLEGLLYDAATNTYSSEWISENINGGQLMYQYNLRPYTNPQTFTITFRYVRPNRESGWVWTTPAIPYIWDANDDGLADVDSIIGVGVGTLFMKTTSDPTDLRPNGYGRLRLSRISGMPMMTALPMSTASSAPALQRCSSRRPLNPSGSCRTCRPATRWPRRSTARRS